MLPGHPNPGATNHDAADSTQLAPANQANGNGPHAAVGIKTENRSAVSTEETDPVT